MEKNNRARGDGDKHREERLKRTRSHVGAQLRSRRNFLGITLEALAARTGMRIAHLAACERGQKDLTVGELCLLAESLQVQPWYFYNGLADKESRDSIRLDDSMTSRMVH
jgi:transcriptional regulator with XRE-family HTH domain